MNPIRSIHGRLAVVAIAATMVGSMLGSATLDSAESAPKKKNHNGAHDFLVAVLALVDAEVCTADDGGTVVCQVIGVNFKNVDILNNLLRGSDIEVLNFEDIEVEDVITVGDVDIEVGDVLSQLDIDVEENNICGVIVGVASLILVECET